MSRWLKSERNRLNNKEVTRDLYFAEIQAKSISQRFENNFRTGRPTIPMISVHGVVRRKWDQPVPKYLNFPKTKLSETFLGFKSTNQYLSKNTGWTDGQSLKMLDIDPG